MEGSKEDIKSGCAALTQEELLERRVSKLRSLSAKYKEEYWRLIAALPESSAPATAGASDSVEKEPDAAGTKDEGDAGESSDGEMPTFSEVEEDVQNGHGAFLAQLRRRKRRRGRGGDKAGAEDDIFDDKEAQELFNLERHAEAASTRAADRQHALAELQGKRVTFLLTSRVVLLGRSTQDEKVDVDFGAEGDASKVSRQQAYLRLRDSGEWTLHNVGRTRMFINGQALAHGHRSVVQHGDLITAGSVHLIFEVNAGRMQRVLQKPKSALVEKHVIVP